MPPEPATQRAPPKQRPPSPQEVALGVFLGARSDAARFEGTRFCVLDEAPEHGPAATHIPIYDASRDEPDVENLERLAREVHAARRAGQPVLIFCGHGARRSPLAAAWYLHRYEHLTLTEAYDRLQSLRPQVERPAEWIGNPDALAR